tara:strand:- start:72 stop:686 length:615 start_codon:yes stop_codon:yes gene_type:complete
MVELNPAKWGKKKEKKKSRIRRFFEGMPATKAVTAVGKQVGKVTSSARKNIDKLKIGEKLSNLPGSVAKAAGGGVTTVAATVGSNISKLRKGEKGYTKGKSYKTTAEQRAKTFKSDKGKSKKDKSFNKGYDKKDHVSSAYERRQKDLTAKTQSNAAESHKLWKEEQARLAKLRRENPEKYKTVKKQIEAKRAARKAKRSGVNMA